MFYDNYFYNGFTTESLNDFIEHCDRIERYLANPETAERAQKSRRDFYLDIESVKIKDIESAIKEAEEAGDNEKKVLLERVKQEVRNARSEMYKRKAPDIINKLLGLDNRQYSYNEYEYLAEAEYKDLIFAEQAIDEIKLDKYNFQNIAYRTNTEAIDYAIKNAIKEAIRMAKGKDIEKTKENEINAAYEEIEKRAEESVFSFEKDREFIEYDKKETKKEIIDNGVDEYIRGTNEEVIKEDIERGIREAEEAGDNEKKEKLEALKRKIESLQRIKNKSDKLRKSATIYGFRYQPGKEHDVERKPDENILDAIDAMFQQLGQEGGATFAGMNYIYVYLTNASDKTDLLKRLKTVDEKLDKYEEILKKTYGKSATYRDAMQGAITTAKEDFESGDILGLDEKVEGR